MFVAMFAASRVHNGINSSCGCFSLIRVFQQSSSTRLFHLRFPKSSLQNQNYGRSKFSSLAKSWSDTTRGKQWSHIQQFMYCNQRIGHRLFSDLSNPLIVNTKVLNNVILYRFEKTLRFKLAAAFAIITLIACLFMVDNVYIVLCRGLFDKEKSLVERIRDHLFPLSAMFIGAVGGPLISITIWFLTVRTVKYAILRKGGNSVTLVTYHPVKQERSITVPIEKVSCESTRHEKKQYVALKLKDYKFKFILEKDGHFVNPELFDCTIGAKR